VAPGGLPTEWEQWPSTERGTFLMDREPGQWYLILKGVDTYTDYGNTVEASRGLAHRAANVPGDPSLVSVVSLVSNQESSQRDLGKQVRQGSSTSAGVRGDCRSVSHSAAGAVLTLNCHGLIRLSHLRRGSSVKQF
jgi:hypothetical protein